MKVWKARAQSQKTNFKNEACLSNKNKRLEGKEGRREEGKEQTVSGHCQNVFSSS